MQILSRGYPGRPCRRGPWTSRRRPRSGGGSATPRPPASRSGTPRGQTRSPAQTQAQTPTKQLK